MNRNAERIYLNSDNSLTISFNDPDRKNSDVFFQIKMVDYSGNKETAFLVLSPDQVEDLIRQLTAMIDYPNPPKTPDDISGEGFA